MSMIEVPVGIGEKVYFSQFLFSEPDARIVEATVYQVMVKAVDTRCRKVKGWFKYRWTYPDGTKSWDELPFESIGEHVFLTEREAEEGLAKVLAGCPR